MVTRGSVFDVAVDVRVGSATFGKWYGCELSEENKRQLWIPPGFAHGFCVTSDECDFVYKCTAAYAPEHERCVGRAHRERVVARVEGVRCEEVAHGDDAHGVRQGVLALGRFDRLERDLQGGLGDRALLASEDDDRLDIEVHRRSRRGAQDLAAQVDGGDAGHLPHEAVAPVLGDGEHRLSADERDARGAACLVHGALNPKRLPTG
jgi:hypothetical protein